MSFSEDFINKFKSDSYMHTDRIVLMDEINKMSYYEFYNFIKTNFNIPYTVEISLKMWFIMLTKKCNSCNQNMIISQNGSEHQYYRCDNCEKTHNFYNYDIDDYAFYKFINNIKS